MCRVEARFVMLARREDEAESLVEAVGRGSRARAADRTGFTADDEAVPVVPAGLEPIDLDMDRMPPSRAGHSESDAHALLERVVLRDLPPHAHVVWRHAS